MSMLFRSVLSSALRMALPLGIGLPLVILGRKHIRSRTLITIQKLMMAGMLLSLVLTLLGRPLVQVSIPDQLPVMSAQTSQALPMPGAPTVTLLQTPIERPISSAPLPALSPWKMAGAVWLCGAAALLLLTLLQNARFLRRVFQNSAPAPADLWEVSLSHGRAIGLRIPPKLRISPEVCTPMAVGCFRPVIFLPVRVLLFAPEEQRLLLSHELYHCRTKDNFWRLFCSVLLAVYWFDPLMWMLARSFSTQCELCCDENVLSGATIQTRKMYGKLILSFIAKRPDHRQPILSLQSGWKGTFRGFQLRLGQIVSLDRKIPGKMVLVGCCAVFVLFSGMIGREVFSPSGVIILPDNPMGFVNAGSHIFPRKKFPISPPIPTDRVFQREYYNGDAKLSHGNLCFLASEAHEKVASGCSGVVAAVRTELPSDVLENSNDPPGELDSLGKFVIIDCGSGITVRYACLNMVLVEPGQWVFDRDVIGAAGNGGTSDGSPDRCEVFVMQDGLMVDPLMFFDFSTEPAVYPMEIE